MLTQENMSACNNACWSLGELAIKAQPQDVAPFATKVVERLWSVLAAPAGSMPRSILENSAITLGRVAWMATEQLAPHLKVYCRPWCNVLRSIRDDIEKEHAFLGLTHVLRANPKVGRGVGGQVTVTGNNTKQACNFWEGGGECLTA